MIKRVVSALPWIIIALGSLGIVQVVAQPEEDHVLFNCYLNGNHSCGNVQPTTGWINLEFWN